MTRDNLYRGKEILDELENITIISGQTNLSQMVFLIQRYYSYPDDKTPFDEPLKTVLEQIRSILQERTNSLNKEFESL